MALNSGLIDAIPPVPRVTANLEYPTDVLSSFQPGLADSEFDIPTIFVAIRIFVGEMVVEKERLWTAPPPFVGRCGGRSPEISSHTYDLEFKTRQLSVLLKIPILCLHLGSYSHSEFIANQIIQ